MNKELTEWQTEIVKLIDNFLAGTSLDSLVHRMCVKSWNLEVIKFNLISEAKHFLK